MLDTKTLDLIDRAKDGGASLTRLKDALAGAAPHDLASTLPQLEARRQVVVFRLLGKDRAMEVFDQLAPTEQSELVGAMATPEVVSLFEDLDPDDRVRLFEELPAKVAKRIIASLSKEARQSVTTLMGYPAESAGRSMSPRYLALRETLSARQAIDALRESDLRSDELRAVFVIDAQRHYRGFVLVPDLLRADANAAVAEVAGGSNVAVSVDTPRLEAARLLQEYDLPAIPVLDSERRMVGVITFDDVIDLLQDEASETMYQKAGIADPRRARDELFSQRLTSGSILYPYRVRILFLMVTLAGGLAVGGLIDAFEETLEALIAAAVFIPLIMDMGGNVGTQSTTIFARGLALGHIDLARFGRVLLREGRVGLLMGATLGTLGGTIAYFWQGVPNDVPQIGIAVGVSLFTVVVIASILGFLLPYVMTRLGFDHAPGADPFITTIKDFTGLALYFYLISVLIGISADDVDAAVRFVGAAVGG